MHCFWLQRSTLRHETPYLHFKQNLLKMNHQRQRQLDERGINKQIKVLLEQTN
uniref:Uncharacterized protein n=1 Tax=Anguilla anguilla TaxID=7936 RepID=A0A0E9SN95_ANGAN